MLIIMNTVFFPNVREKIILLFFRQLQRKERGRFLFLVFLQVEFVFTMGYYGGYYAVASHVE